MSGPRTVGWVAEQAEVDEETAQDVLAEMVDAGTLTRDGDRYEVNEYAAVADYIRDIGEETEEGILIPWETIDEFESPPS